MQFSTVLFGIMLGAIITLISEKMPLVDYVGILVFVFVAVVELPLLYLRALRHFVLESQSQPILRKE